ncbi:hypothetical protein ACLOJK_002471 [Asimina triloba]
MIERDLSGTGREGDLIMKLSVMIFPDGFVRKSRVSGNGFVGIRRLLTISDLGGTTDDTVPFVKDSSVLGILCPQTFLKGQTRPQLTETSLSSSQSCIMSSCVKPLLQSKMKPVVLLHGFDRYAYPLLEDAGLETWAVDILGWGFSDLESRPSCDVASKREHLYQILDCGLFWKSQFWKSYIKNPMVLVGPSLGAAVAIDFAANHPGAVEKLVLIDASVYAEGTGNMKKLPKILAYAGVGRLHCLLPWWEDATVDFMISGGYDVTSKIKLLKHKTLIIWGEDDQIINSDLSERLHDELLMSVLHRIPDCGHLPHVEKPDAVAQLIVEFVQGVGVFPDGVKAAPRLEICAYPYIQAVKGRNM